MSNGVARNMKRDVVRFALTGFVGAWVAGCSADASRMSEGSPFSNPFASNTAAPTPQVSATPLASAAPANPGYVAAAHPSPVVASALPSAAPASTGQIHDP